MIAFYVFDTRDNRLIVAYDSLDTAKQFIDDVLILGDEGYLEIREVFLHEDE